MTILDTPTVAVCTQCAVIVANGDETAVCECITFEPHEANACGSLTRSSSMELLASDAPLDAADRCGYWTCFVCDAIQIGGPALIYPVNDR